ncbi:hypothetical protein PLICRDRAFT_181257 [Plicaturopsis crispa FD-325 SS-3]|uniref:Uncharacterized protein n=1 Tax=Plicaturopsis crispa FD-325 SS-3 TaxID=944288 RepID=A0A0C9SJU9_PLICR|nr:hypothetical protein PLICRDRAFT_181257 [Plicaturopsis crispa FD-325 SS-3]
MPPIVPEFPVRFLGNLYANKASQSERSTAIRVVRAYHRNKGWLKESVNRSSYKRWPSDIVRADVRTGFHVSSETGRDLKRGGHLTVNFVSASQGRLRPACHIFRRP